MGKKAKKSITRKIQREEIKNRQLGLKKYKKKGGFQKPKLLAIISFLKQKKERMLKQFPSCEFWEKPKVMKIFGRSPLPKNFTWNMEFTGRETNSACHGFSDIKKPYQNFQNSYLNRLLTRDPFIASTKQV